MSVRLTFGSLFAGVLVCGVALSASVSFGAPVGSSRPSSCTPYLIVDSRGSGEPLNTLSPPGARFVAEWNKLHPGVFTPVIKNPYPAVGWTSFPGAGAKVPGRYHASVVEGKNFLGQFLRRQASACRGQKLLLTGYSQGAQVTADDVQDNQVSVIFGVALFGDPYFNSRDPVDRGGFSYGRNGWLGQRPLFVYSQREHVLSYCHYHDPVCQGAGLYGDSQHTNYDKLGEPEQAAQYFTQLEKSGSSPSVQPSGSARIATAPVVVPGVIYHEDVSKPPTAQLNPQHYPHGGGVCDMWAGRWWKLSMRAGETATIAWEVFAPASGFYQTIIFPPSTMDSNVIAVDLAKHHLFGDSNVPGLWSHSSSSSGVITLYARQTATYPFIIGDGCPSVDGPLSFKVAISKPPPSGSASGGATIATAPVVVAGIVYHEDVSKPPTAQLDPQHYPHDGGVCDMWAGKWWKLGVRAGNTVTITWNVIPPASGWCQTIIFPSTTTDQNVIHVDLAQRRLVWSHSDSSSATATFHVPQTATYPFIIGSGCPSADGPLTFRVRITGR